MTRQTAGMPDEDQLFLRPAKLPRYNERNTTGAELEFIMELIAALRRELAKPALVILFVGRRLRHRKNRGVLALLSSVRLDLSQRENRSCSALRSWLGPCSLLPGQQLPAISRADLMVWFFNTSQV